MSIDYIAALNPSTGDVIEYNGVLYIYIKTNQSEHFNRHRLLMLDDINFHILNVMGNLDKVKMVCRFNDAL